MTEKLFDSLRILVSLFRLDLKHLLQRITNPIVFAVLLLILLSFTLSLGTFHHLASVYAPLHGVSNPKYGLGGYEPLLFYLCIVVVLIFALRLPSYREESIKNVVITYREPNNFLLTLSRVLTPTLVVFGSIVATALAYQVIASIDVANNPGVLEPFELQSLIFVLVELFFGLLFWTSLAVLIAHIFKSAPIGFIGTFVILILQSWISPALPGELGSFTFGYGAANLYVSEIAPTYWEAKHIIYFLSIVFLAFAFIFATSWYLDRTDPSKQVAYRPMIVILTSLGIVSQVVVQASNLVGYSQQQSWNKEQERFAASVIQQASINAIEGEVSIKPGSKLSLNLNYKFVLNTTEIENSSQFQPPYIWLALNPGIKVQSVQCSDADMYFSHENGTLLIGLSSCDPNDNQEYSIDIVASGKPDPLYLVKHISRGGHADVEPQLVRLMGQKSSIFTSDYVALTPSSHWYPQLLSGSTPVDDSAKTHATDVSLKIDLAPTSWKVIASGGKLLEASSSQDGRRLLSGNFQTVGLIAADFRVSTHSSESIDVNVVVHKRHAKRLERNQILIDALVGYVSDAITKLESYDIDYPFDEFTIVEVPSTLSLLNHENSVNLGMESIVMFRESSIAFARLYLVDDWQAEFEQAEADESPMAEFLKNQVGFIKSLYWTNPIFNYTYEDAVVDSLVSGRINRSDEHSNLAKLVLETLLFNLLESKNYRFDFDLANSLASESHINLRYIWAHRRGSSIRLDLLGYQDGLTNSNRFWESIERSFLFTEKDSRQDSLLNFPNRLRIQRFRVLKLSEILADLYEEQTIATTLTDILSEGKAAPIDLDLITRVATANDMEIGSLVQNTLLNTKLPGINFSVARQTEYEEPNENGERFNTVLNLRNNEDTVAYVSFQVVETQELVQGGQTFRTVANDFKLGPFELKEQSSYQLEVNTANFIGNLDANTFLSLNRGQVELAVGNTQSTEELSTIGDATNNWFSFVDSQWNSSSKKDEVIVDDLDPGFEIPASNFRKPSNFWTFGSSLFRQYFPIPGGMDNGLPINQNPNGPWTRNSGRGCWGKYRSTYALADTSKRGVHKVAFNSEIPKKGRWSLSYYHPDVASLRFLGIALGKYDIEVTASEQSWNLDVSANDMTVGWNEISTLEIDSPGEIKVAVSNESDGPYVYADAIKWNYLD
ncbi:MAG: hypothetical protein F4Z01_05525 [Gammaproteobacteria bacterium]|nr:hypothetical protein [Gammaproteobacteria bacterium]MYF39092.1 hypothetical protein [Gammaproteobacteria bacterium]